MHYLCRRLLYRTPGTWYNNISDINMLSSEYLYNIILKLYYAHTLIVLECILLKIIIIKDTFRFLF